MVMAWAKLSENLRSEGGIGARFHRPTIRVRKLLSQAYRA